MNAARFTSELEKYELAFRQFVSKHDLPLEWFQKPDHVAIKCADAEDYGATCEEFKPLVQGGIWEIEMDSRKLASAQLLTSLVVAQYSFEWLEIMQPRLGKETTHGFVEHTEFVFADFEAVQTNLAENSIEFELQQNTGHQWINLVIDGLGREIKLNNKPLEAVAHDERTRGELHLRN